MLGSSASPLQQRAGSLHDNVGEVLHYTVSAFTEVAVAVKGLQNESSCHLLRYLQKLLLKD